MKNKKAVEWPVVMIYVIFTTILFIMGTFMVLKLLNISGATIDKNLDELKFTLLADRIINSADCVAWEEPITEGGLIKFQVRPGIVSFNKVFSGNITHCIKDTRYYLELADFDGDWSVSTNPQLKDVFKVKDTYFVQIHREGYAELHDGALTIGLIE